MKILKLLTCLLMLFISSSVYSQGWERLYDDGHDETILNSSLSPDGGLVLGGSRHESIDTGEPYIIRTNTEGDVLWSYLDTMELDTSSYVDGILAASDGSVFYTTLTSDLNSPNRSATFKKLSPTGEFLWSFVVPRGVVITNDGMIQLDDENIVLVGQVENSVGFGIAKYDLDGNLIWSSIIERPMGRRMFARSVIEATNGDLLVSGYTYDSSGNQNVAIVRLNSSGGEIWQKTYPRTNRQFGHTIVRNQANEYVMAVLTVDLANGDTESSLLKVDQNGDEIWWEPLVDFSSVSTAFMDLVATSDGFALGENVEISGEGTNFQLTRVDQDGIILFSKTYGGSKDDRFFNIFNTTDDGFFLTGYTQKVDDSFDGYVVKTDSLGTSFTNQLSGKVFFDEDADCLLPGPSTDLNNWIVKVRRDNFEWLTTTDQNGDYSFDLDTGTYEVTTFPVSPYWDLCQDTVAVTYTNFFESQTADFPAQASLNCPYLEVSVSTPFLRRCFENTYYIDYCNQGTDVATNAYIEFTLDPEMTYLSSSIPFTTQNGLTYTFNVGDLGVGVCNRFFVDVQLGCNSVLLGQTHCVEAHIYPDTLCLPPPATWSGASINVDGTCVGDSIIFFIQNIGTAPTQGAIEYIVIEDDVILMRANDVLAVNEIKRLAIAATGKTYRLEAEQESGHPGVSAPSESIERCIDGSGGAVSLGYITQFPQNDGDAYVDIDCQENIGAYDPNDKKAYPKGATVENIINQNKDIEYLIRFQNTGTDTAFNVVIKDTLSELLDPTSIRVGTSSHPFTYTLTGTGVLQFRFADIMLPDSNINEPASHGFVRFKIAQQPDLPFGTQIFNDADIYFDFNAPIVTNETFHTIGELLLTVDVEEIRKEGVNIKVFPNPFSQQSTMEIMGMDEVKQGQFVIYNSTGQQLRRQDFTGNQLKLSRNNLPAGIYFFQVSAEGQLIGSGKLLVQ